MPQRSIEEIQAIVDSSPHGRMPRTAEEAEEQSHWEGYTDIDDYIVDHTDLTTSEFARAYPHENVPNGVLDNLTFYMNERAPERLSPEHAHLVEEEEEEVETDDYDTDDLEYEGPMGEFLGEDAANAPILGDILADTDDIEKAEETEEGFKDRHIIDIESAPLPIRISSPDPDDYLRSLADIIKL